MVYWSSLTSKQWWGSGIPLLNWTESGNWIYMTLFYWKGTFWSNLQCHIVQYNTAYYLFIFFQVWQQLPWQRLWSYRKWNLWPWTAFTEVGVKMEPSQKMKSSILMQVRDAVPSSRCPGALNTWVSNSWALVFWKLCSISTKSEVVLSLLRIPPVFFLTAPFTNCLKNTGEGSSSLGLDTDLLKCPPNTCGVTKDFCIGNNTGVL